MDNKTLEVLQPYCENDMRLLKRISQSIFLRFNEPLTKADYDEFYSIANMTLWQAYQSYNPKVGTFEGFLYSCLQRKFKTELTRRHRQKRVFDNYNISLDAINDTEEECSLLDFIPSDFDTFDEVLEKQDKEQYTDKVQEYISKLSNQQVNILNLLIDGYKPIEIRKILGISTKEYADDLQIMRDYENVKVLF
ncbi:MAG: sigma-70 family RNA polymerase sigma factor [Floccifex sp.]